MPLKNGFFKMKGKMWTVSPERFNQMQSRSVQPWYLRKIELIGYCVDLNGVYWLISETKDGYVKVQFAKNRYWFDAFTSEIEFLFIRDLPQIYVVGLA